MSSDDKETIEYDYYESPDGLKYFAARANERFALTPARGWGMPDINYTTQQSVITQHVRVTSAVAVDRILVWDHRFQGCGRCEFWDGQYTIADLMRPDRVSKDCFLKPGKLVKVLPDGKLYYVEVFLQRGPKLDPDDTWDEWGFTERLEFVAFNPFVLANEVESYILQQNTSSATVNRILHFDNCTWSDLGGANGIIRSVTHSGNNIYFVGNFTSIGTLVGTNAAYYNRISGIWTALPNIPGATYTKIRISPIGEIYVAGILPGLNNIAKYGAGVWNALGLGTNGRVNDIDFSGDGVNVYAGGLFVTAGGVVSNNVAYWNNTAGAWFTMTTGTNNEVHTIQVAENLNGLVAVGGVFSIAGGIAVLQLAIWRPFDLAWNFIEGVRASVGPGSVLAGEFDDIGNYYATGNFTQMGNVLANNAAVYNGNNWIPMGSGIDLPANGITVDPRNQDAWYFGQFTTAGLLSLVSGIAKWVGSVWQPVPAIPVSAAPPAYIEDVTISREEGFITIVGKFDGTPQVAACSVVTANCNRFALPIITFYGPGSIYEITNTDDNKSIYFDYELVDSEVAVLDLSREPHLDNRSVETDALTFISNVRGSVIGKVRPGSALSSFVVQPGDSEILAFADPTVSVTVQFRCRFWSMATCIQDSPDLDVGCLSVVKQMSLDLGVTWVENATILDVTTVDEVRYRLRITNCSKTIDLEDAQAFDPSANNFIGPAPVFLPAATTIVVALPTVTICPGGGCDPATLFNGVYTNIGYGRAFDPVRNRWISASDSATLTICDPNASGTIPC